MPSFQNKKELKFVITLATGTFGSSSANQIMLQGLRASVDIDKAGGMMMGTLHAQIWGVSQSDMNSVTTLQWRPSTLTGKNIVSVYALDGAQQTLVFQGNIVNSWGVYDNQPDVYLMIQAQAAYFNQLNPVVPTSTKGTIDAAMLIKQLAESMGYTFEGNGASFSLSNPYLPNTAMEQVKTLVRTAGFGFYLDDTVLAITPNPNTPRNGTIVPEISSASGLKGYPIFDGIGVNFETLFNPSVRFGGAFKLLTSVKSVTDISSQWIATSIAHNLSSEKPGAPWFSRVRGTLSGLAIVTG